MKVASLIYPGLAQVLFGARTDEGSQVTHHQVSEGCLDSLTSAVS